MSPKQFLPYPWPLWWIFSLLNYFSFLSQPWLSLHLHFIVLQMLDPQHCLFIYFPGSLLDFDHTSPLMYDFAISSSSPIFDMLVKWLLEILFNLPFWIYLSFTLFTMCLVPLLSFQINTALDSSLNFWFQSTSSNSKILRWTAPRILMHVQVIWDPSHLKNRAASSS